MKLYFHEVEKARPCILIVPGGGYAVVSPSEGEIVAKKFYEMGYQTASAKPNAVILSYPVITSGDCAHRGSFTALLGADASEEELAQTESMNAGSAKQVYDFFHRPDNPANEK